MMRAVLNPVTQHVDHSALSDLALQPGKELLPSGTGVFYIQRLD